MRIALFEPDIPQNTGTILRLCACLGVEAHLIEPAGFPVSDRAFRRAGMDYLDQVAIVRHTSWSAFEQFLEQAGCKLVVFTTRATESFIDHRFNADDVLLFGPQAAQACVIVASCQFVGGSGVIQAPGLYYAEFTGTGGGTSGYSGNISTTELSAVPIPAVGAGLPGIVAAVAGFLAWRRRKQTSALSAA